MTIKLTNPEDWSTSPALLYDLITVEGLNEQVVTLASQLANNADLVEKFKHEVSLCSGRITTAWMARGISSDYLGLDVVDRIPQDEVRKDILEHIALSPSPLTPLDLRAYALADLLTISTDVGDLIDKWKTNHPNWTDLPSVDLIKRDTDGIDHVYDVPVDQDGFVALLMYAAERYLVERVNRLLEGVSRTPRSPTEGHSPELEEVIRRNLRAPLLEPSDFIVEWDLVVSRDSSGSPLTIAEIAKALLVHPLAKLPVRDIRRAAVAFYRSVFGVGGRSIVGLGAGFLYVEHGLTADPSYVFIAQDAIIGKGVTLDTVGGVVLGTESFVGGGFLPLLIHTHKHLRALGASAASERKRISKTAFVAEEGARFPMNEIGLFECADHIDGPEPFPGIRVVAIED